MFQIAQIVRHKKTGRLYVVVQAMFLRAEGMAYIRVRSLDDSITPFGPARAVDPTRYEVAS